MWDRTRESMKRWRERRGTRGSRARLPPLEKARRIGRSQDVASRPALSDTVESPWSEREDPGTPGSAAALGEVPPGFCSGLQSDVSKTSGIAAAPGPEAASPIETGPTSNHSSMPAIQTTPSGILDLLIEEELITADGAQGIQTKVREAW